MSTCCDMTLMGTHPEVHTLVPKNLHMDRLTHTKLHYNCTERAILTCNAGASNHYIAVHTEASL